MDFLNQLTWQNTSYLWGITLLLPLWLYGFIKYKGSRNEMLRSGLIFGVGSILIGYFYATKDYWNPPYIFNNVLHFEDFLYGFFFGGLASEIFEIILGKKSIKRTKKPHKKFVIVALIITIATFVICVNILKLNSIVAHILPPMIIGLICIVYRRDFIVPAILSGLFLLIITFAWQSLIMLFYPEVISNIWYVQNLSGVLISGIPLEELIFGFSLGFGASCFYELLMGYEYTKR